VKRQGRIPVAVFFTSFDAGGTERQMTELVRRLDRTRFDVHVACFHRRGVWLPQVAAVVDEIAEFPIHGFRALSTVVATLAFARWCLRHRIQVVHAADLYGNAFALPAAWLVDVRVRIGSRREVHPRGRGLEALQRLGYRCAQRIVANSEAGAARLRREGIAGRRISVIRNGLEPDAFRNRPARTRGFRVVTVSRLRPEKAHEVLIAAIARLRHAHPRVELHIVGDGPREQPLREMVAREGLRDSVRFLGHRDDVPALLGRADAFVLPSRFEASPNAALEAMAAGLPVIASDVGGIPETITDGVTGLLVPPDNPELLAGALFRLFDDAAQADRLAASGREYVRAHYSFDRMVAAFEELYLSELWRRRHRFPMPHWKWRGAQAATS
jgi:L-malate glycosyltransferase